MSNGTTVRDYGVNKPPSFTAGPREIADVGFNNADIISKAYGDDEFVRGRDTTRKFGAAGVDSLRRSIPPMINEYKPLLASRDNDFSDATNTTRMASRHQRQQQSPPPYGAFDENSYREQARLTDNVKVHDSINRTRMNSILRDGYRFDHTQLGKGSPAGRTEWGTGGGVGGGGTDATFDGRRFFSGILPSSEASGGGSIRGRQRSPTTSEMKRAAHERRQHEEHRLHQGTREVTSLSLLKNMNDDNDSIDDDDDDDGFNDDADIGPYYYYGPGSTFTPGPSARSATLQRTRGRRWGEMGLGEESEMLIGNPGEWSYQETAWEGGARGTGQDGTYRVAYSDQGKRDTKLSQNRRRDRLGAQ